MDALTLWPAEAVPPTATHVDRHRNDDAAKYARTVAAGLVWYCPDRCIRAHSDECSCPCGRRCHMMGACPGHR